MARTALHANASQIHTWTVPTGPKPKGLPMVAAPAPARDPRPNVTASIVESCRRRLGVCPSSGRSAP
eukprot:scaffold322527_cov33-Tisochrysis_lutea.AAC.5